MMTVIYMSWLATTLGREEEKVDLTENVSTLAALERWLAARGGAFTLFSRDDVVYAAINGSVGNKEILLHDGDEVCFFAPIAGG